MRCTRIRDRDTSFYDTWLDQKKDVLNHEDSSETGYAH